MPAKTKPRVPETMGVGSGLVDARAKQVLREAVDAVVNSFAKHTQGYGRGEKKLTFYLTIVEKFSFSRS